jgi:cytosine/adenosine deaminase-related metal-dependent hydrolase
MGSRYALRHEVEQAIRLVARGLVRPVVDDVLPLERANEALERLEHGRVQGRLVLRVHKPSEGGDDESGSGGARRNPRLPHGRVRADLVIREGRIVGHTAPGEAEGKEIVEADGLYVLPGGVDAHVTCRIRA